jgi:hypothetical protein
LDYYQSLSYSKKSLQALRTHLFRFNSYVNGLEISAITGIAYPHLAGSNGHRASLLPTSPEF